MASGVGKYIGLMSGTSLDSMDAILVDFTTASKVNKPNSKQNYKVLARESIPYDADLRQKLHKFNEDDRCSLSHLAALDRGVAILAASVTKQLLSNSGTLPSDIQAIAFAGQTIAHHPPDRFNQQGAEQGWTTQCGDPNILAEETGIKVVADIRRRDLAAGGQGAPLASAFHHSVFSSDGEERGIINLGGISNITILHPNKKPIGFDMGPANCLLDEWNNLYNPNNKLGYDKGGKWAATGKVINDLLTSFLGDPYFSKPPPKTTGRDYFNMEWLDNYLQGMDEPYEVNDVQATLVDLVALSISLAIQSYCGSVDDDEWREGKRLSLYVSGGGARNDFLLQRIKHLVKFPIMSIEVLGVKEKDLEALAFAWLAFLRINNKNGNLPSITGAGDERILGAVYI